MQEKVSKALKIVHYSGIGAVVVIVACTVLFGILPMRRSAAADASDAQKLGESINRLDQLHMANLAAKGDLDVSQGRLDEAEKHLPSGPPDAAFNNELTAVAKASGINTEGSPAIKPEEAKDFGPYKMLQLTFTGTGDWQSCYKFLAGLRGMKQIARLDSVLLELPNTDPKARASDRVTCTLTVKFSTFYLPER